ncbi:MAG: CBS domain-containing protein [Alphaproteobacteria bacterium]
MQARDLMRPCGDPARPGTPITEVAQMMAAAFVRALPVAEDGRFLGIVTDWDISCRTVIRGKEVAATVVGDVMAPGYEACDASTAIEVAVAQMDRRGVPCLPVLDRDLQLLGMLHRADAGRADA